MLERALSLFRPFGCSPLIGKTASVAVLQVRCNCPWHRSSFTPCFFPFRVNKKVKNDVQKRSQTEGGRHILMRRVLGEKHFIAWNWPSKKPQGDRLNYPL
ncbi:hypothetical protein GPALN_003593 [Globodera pallida]|uniref:Secreted protein n=1 Tax=Globodera pallida TaxID=36090 RepID=A0A183CFU9_GLOPA|nr:hypothetical protein GPALN_003593 [Globodera pallida]